jgi:hypothetical protein
MRFQTASCFELRPSLPVRACHQSGHVSHLSRDIRLIWRTPVCCSPPLASVSVMATLALIVSDRDELGEQVRRLRLRAHRQRSLAVSLQETIELTSRLFELREAAQRIR